MNVAVYFAPNGTRSKLVADAMFQGIHRHVRTVQKLSSLSYVGRPQHDIALFYGLSEGLSRVLNDYVNAGRTAVYIDLGYWGRRKKTRYDGFHKLSVNGRHPTDYFQNHPHPDDRFRHFDLPIRPWRESGKHIIVAGMSGKGSLAEGFAPEQWERQAVAKLRSFTRRPIIYRPKPNYVSARPIPGTIFQRDVPLDEALAGAHAVVCHHSNVAIDAIISGVPAFCVKGAALPMAAEDLCMIENPFMPEGREQWAADLAYTQYSIEEMMRGMAWAYLRSEGIVP